MKVYVPTAGVRERIHVLDWIPEDEITFVCHRPVDCFRTLVSKPASSDPHDRVQANRNLILDTILPDEWAIVIDDNVRGVVGYADEIWHGAPDTLKLDHENSMTVRDYCWSWHEAVNNNHLTWPEVRRRLYALSQTCDNMDIPYGGVTFKKAYIHRLHAYAFFATFPTCLVISKGHRLRFPQHALHDTDMCLQWIQKAGCVPSCQWMRPIKDHYQPGGLGPLGERNRLRLPAAKTLADTYPFVEVHSDDPARIRIDIQAVRDNFKELRQESRINLAKRYGARLC
jgi:hypothetical protein